ncbi:hypothetical protein ACFL5G_02145 [Candidatus Margulisiibacteriota bacterium]
MKINANNYWQIFWDADENRNTRVTKKELEKEIEEKKIEGISKGDLSKISEDKDISAKEWDNYIKNKVLTEQEVNIGVETVDPDIAQNLINKIKIKNSFKKHIPEEHLFEMLQRGARPEEIEKLPWESMIYIKHVYDYGYDVYPDANRIQTLSKGVCELLKMGMGFKDILFLPWVFVSSHHRFNVDEEIKMTNTLVEVVSKNLKAGMSSHDVESLPWYKILEYRGLIAKSKDYTKGFYEYAIKLLEHFGNGAAALYTAGMKAEDIPKLIWIKSLYEIKHDFKNYRTYGRSALGRIKIYPYIVKVCEAGITDVEDINKLPWMKIDPKHLQSYVVKLYEVGMTDVDDFNKLPWLETNQSALAHGVASLYQAGITDIEDILKIPWNDLNKGRAYTNEAQSNILGHVIKVCKAYEAGMHDIDLLNELFFDKKWPASFGEGVAQVYKLGITKLEDINKLPWRDVLNVLDERDRYSDEGGALMKALGEGIGIVYQAGMTNIEDINRLPWVESINGLGSYDKDRYGPGIVKAMAKAAVELVITEKVPLELFKQIKWANYRYEPSLMLKIFSLLRENEFSLEETIKIVNSLKRDHEHFLRFILRLKDLVISSTKAKELLGSIVDKENPRALTDTLKDFVLFYNGEPDEDQILIYLNNLYQAYEFTSRNNLFMGKRDIINILLTKIRNLDKEIELFNGEVIAKKTERLINTGNYTKAANLRNDLQSISPAEDTLAYLIAEVINTEYRYYYFIKKETEDSLVWALLLNEANSFYLEKYPYAMIPNDFSSDVFRKQICQSLSANSCYMMIKDNAAALSIYSFREICTRLGQIEDMEEALIRFEQEDPRGFEQFLTNLIKLGGTSYIQHYDFIFPRVFKLLDKSTNALDTGMNLTVALERLFKDVNKPFQELDRLYEESEELFKSHGKDSKAYEMKLAEWKQQRQWIQDNLSFLNAQKYYKEKLGLKIVNDWKTEYEAYLADNSRNTEKLRLLSFWIKEFHMEFDGELGARMKEVADVLPDLGPYREFPESWLADNKIRGKVALFADADFQLQLCQTLGSTDHLGFNGLGYNLDYVRYANNIEKQFEYLEDGSVRMTSYKRVKKEIPKQNEWEEQKYEWVLEEQSKTKIKFTKNKDEDVFITYLDGEKEGQTELLISKENPGTKARVSRTLDNGNTVEIILQKGVAGIEADHQSPGEDLEAIFQRGHLVQWSVFPKQDKETPPKLLGLFGCGGANPGTINKLRELGYPEDLFIGDSDGAHGFISNMYIARTLEALALGVKNSDELQEHLQEKISTYYKDGIVLPNDPFIVLKRNCEKIDLNVFEGLEINEWQEIDPAIKRDSIKLDIPVKTRLAFPYIEAGNYNFKIGDRAYKFTVTQQQLDILNKITTNPIDQAEILMTIFLETGTGGAFSWRAAAKAMVGSTSVGPAQVRYASTHKLLYNYLQGITDLKARFPEGYKLLEKIKKTKDKTQIKKAYEEYLKTDEGAILSAYLLYKDIELQMITQFRAMYPRIYDTGQYDKNQAEHRIIKYATFRSSLKSHLLALQEYRVYRLAKQYGMEIKEEPQSLKESIWEGKEHLFIDGVGTQETVRLVKEILVKNGFTIVDKNKQSNIYKKEISEKDIENSFYNGHAYTTAIREGVAAQAIQNIYRREFGMDDPAANALYMPKEVAEIKPPGIAEENYLQKLKEYNDYKWIRTSTRGYLMLNVLEQFKKQLIYN